jgi:hypothetical protein
MRTIYLRKDYNNYTRKILMDMAYLVSHKKIRLPKTYFEDNLYFSYLTNDKNEQPQKYFLTRDKIISEDTNHYFFAFPFKAKQVEDTAF